MSDDLKAPSQLDQKEEGANQQTVQDPSDKLTPEHPRFKDVLQEKNELKQTVGELQEQLQELKAQIAERQVATGDDEPTEDERIAIEKIKRELKKSNFITKGEVEDSLRVERRALQHDKLSNKYDGNNGYPKYDSLDVTEYARRHGYADNYEAAYYDMHRPAIIQVEAKRMSRGEVPPASEPPTGGERNISGTDITPTKVGEMDLGDWEQNRTKVLENMRSAARRATVQ